MKILIKIISIIVLSSFTGFFLVYYFMYDLFPWDNKTLFNIKIEIRGSKGQPVSGAKIFLKGNETFFLGFSDKQGNIQDNLFVNNSSYYKLIAEGHSYYIEKKIYLSRSPINSVNVRFDPDEAKKGNITLVSKTLEEMAKNISNKNNSNDVNNSLKTPNLLKTPQPQNKAKNKSRNKNYGINELREFLGDYLVNIISNKNDVDDFFVNKSFNIIENVIKENINSLAEKEVNNIYINVLKHDDYYIELYATTINNNFLGGALLRPKIINEYGIEWTILNMLHTERKIKNSSTLFIVKKSLNKDFRVYYNGLSLSTYSFDKLNEFYLPVNNNDDFVLAVSTNDGIFIRKILSQKSISSEIIWELPNLNISLK